MTDKTQTLVDEKLALSMFLDSLLFEPDVEQAVLPETEPLTDVVSEAAPLSDIDLPQTSVAQEVKLEEKQQVVTQAKTEVNQEIPDWALEPFQILLFKVAGLTLAVPLHALNGVVEWPESLTEMPGHADFYLGILQHLGESIPIVDTAKLVFPQDKLKQLMSDEPTERVERIVLINDGKWGLACDEVAQVVTLSPEQVRWRSQRTQRRWLLGTVIEHMCALLDTEAFAERLESGQD